MPKLAVLSLLSHVLAARSCTSSRDCSLNGDCVNGKCHCDPAWSGSAHCDVLRFLPVNKSQTGYHNSSFASWGGVPIFEDGKYHLFMAQMTKHCGLETWGSNSEIVRAESERPGGPYVFKETVLPPFAHNPTVRRHPDGGIVLFFIGSGDGSGHEADCSNASSIDMVQHESLQVSNGSLLTGSVHAMYAKSVHGPWTKPVSITFNSSSAWSMSSVTNPSPHIEADGTVTLALNVRFNHNPGKSLVGVSRAKDWRGPYTMITPSPVTPQEFICSAGMGEDPYLWKDRRGWHIIYHGMCPSGIMQAHYAYSSDAVQWVTSPRQTYSYFVKQVDSSMHLSTLAFARCERPQLLFDEAGLPTHLFNGVCDGSTPAMWYECDIKQAGMTWTLARPLAQKAEHFLESSTNAAILV